MKSATKRPIAVWIALGILLVYIAMFVLVLITPASESVLDARDVTDVVIDVVEGAVIILSWMIAFWAIAVRREWGRWFVLIPLAYIIGALAWDHLVFPESVVENPEDMIDLLVAACIILGPILFAFLLVSFGSDVKNYFAATTEPSNDTESPADGQ